MVYSGNNLIDRDNQQLTQFIEQFNARQDMGSTELKVRATPIRDDVIIKITTNLN